MKKGDKVRCISHADHWINKSAIPIGHILTVNQLNTNDTHFALEGSSLWYKMDCFELVDENKPWEPQINNTYNLY